VNRSAAGVLVSDAKGRDIKIDAYTLSFHGRLLIEGAEISLNYGNRYGLLGDNGSGKVCLVPPDQVCRFANDISQLSSNLLLSAISRSLHISTFILFRERQSRLT